MKHVKGIGILLLLGLATYGTFVIIFGERFLPENLAGTEEESMDLEAAPAFDPGAPTIGDPPEMGLATDWPPSQYDLPGSSYGQQYVDTSAGNPTTNPSTGITDPNMLGGNSYAQASQPGNPDYGQDYGAEQGYDATSVNLAGNDAQGMYAADPGDSYMPVDQAHDSGHGYANDPAINGMYDTSGMNGQASATQDPVGPPPLPADMFRGVANQSGIRVGADPLPELAANAELVRDDFTQFMTEVCENLNRGQILPMYELLCQWYGDPRLTLAERQLLTKVLDQVTGTVVYSREHWLAKPYVVRQGETLDQIASQHRVPTELLAKINGIADPQYLEPGTELKVLPGPYEAVVDLSDHQIVVRLANGRYYAGRFKIGIGQGMDEFQGTYKVGEKQRDPEFVDGNNERLAPDNPNNPLAGYWIGLGSGIGLHGTNYPEDIGTSGKPGTGFICLLPKEMDDLFDMLSSDSFVTIQR